jgi:type IV pilus assembly protein PilE
MIAVAIVGILAAIAFPSYNNYVKKTRRAEIVQLLSESAQLLERHYSKAGSYANTTTAPIVTTPDPTGNAYYGLTVDRQATTFTLTAVPIAGTVMAGDMCGSFILTNTGSRSNTNNTAAGTVAVCWGR